MTKSEANNTDVKKWEDHSDPDLRAYLPPVTLNFDSHWKVRFANALMCIPGPTSKGVKMKKVGIGAYYFPSNMDGDGTTKSSAAIMWIHGGGRAMGNASGLMESAVCSRIVHLFGIPVLSAKYRLATDCPFPAALDDVHQAYHWLAGHLESKSTRLSNSPVKIALAGDSAGAGLVAELCQRLLDESQDRNAPSSSEQSVPLPVCQLLNYPMLDDRTCVSKELVSLPPHLGWNEKSNMYCWSCYLGPNHKPGDENLPEYASASRRKDLSNLPPACIQVGELDLFRTECEKYARRMGDDGVETEFVEVKGAFHGFMYVGKDEKPVVEAWERVQVFGRKYLFD